MFDRVNVQNEYVCIVNKKTIKTKFVDPDIVQTIPQDKASTLWNRENVDVFVFHSIPYEYYDYVLSIGSNRIVIAVSWGFDIYYSQMGCPPLLQLVLYKPKTSRLLKDLNKTSFVKLKIRRALKCLLKREYRIRRLNEKQQLNERRILQRRVLDRIDFWSTVLPFEYELLRTHVGIVADSFPIHYTYRFLSESFPTIDVGKVGSIMIGNSSDPTNNHLDILDILTRRRIQNRLFVPLAYGVDDYRDAIVNYLMSHSIDSDIQTELVPRKEYMEKLMHCGAAVLGHIRQQAVGNLNLCMLLGIKVFLFKESIAYHYFKSLGSFVYSIEDDLFPEELLKPLTKEQIEINRKNLDWLSLDRVIPEVNQAFERIEQNLVKTRS